MHGFLRKTMTLKPSALLCFCVHSASLFNENGPQVNAIVGPARASPSLQEAAEWHHTGDPRGEGTHGKAHPLDRVLSQPPEMPP